MRNNPTPAQPSEPTDHDATRLWLKPPGVLHNGLVILLGLSLLWKLRVPGPRDIMNEFPYLAAIGILLVIYVLRSIAAVIVSVDADLRPSQLPSRWNWAIIPIVAIILTMAVRLHVPQWLMVVFK